MTPTDQLHQDLAFVADAVRRNERPLGTPAIYFLWAVLVLVGFALPDFAPRSAGLYWFVAGIGGGALSMWLGARDSRRQGLRDSELGKRHGLHWLVGGAGFLLAALPLMTGRGDIGQSVGNFLLVAGLVYAMAGIHLVRPLLWSGLLMLLAYAVLVMFAPPYTWTITGAVIAVSLLWAGSAARAERRAGALE